VKLSTRLFREEQHARMVYHTRHNHLGQALCHYCEQQPGSQMHELVNRAQTSSNEEALRLSFTETLCSWLCSDCHVLAPTRDVEKALWQRNLRVYGAERVFADLERLIHVLGTQPIIALPETENAAPDFEI